MAREVRLGLGHPAGHLDAVARERLHGGRRRVADDRQLHAGQLAPHEREDLVAEVVDRVAVRRVAEVADEQQAVAACGRRGAVVAGLVDVGHDVDVGAGKLGEQRVAIGVGDDEHGVGGGVRRELALLRAGRARGGDRIAGQLGLALLADVVHVDRVDDDARERRVLAHERQVLGGEVVEAEDRRVVTGLGEQRRAGRAGGRAGTASCGRDRRRAPRSRPARAARGSGRSSEHSRETNVTAWPAEASSSSTSCRRREPEARSYIGISGSTTSSRLPPTRWLARRTSAGCGGSLVAQRRRPTWRGSARGSSPGAA